MQDRIRNSVPNTKLKPPGQPSAAAGPRRRKHIPGPPSAIPAGTEAKLAGIRPRASHVPRAAGRGRSRAMWPRPGAQPRNIRPDQQGDRGARSGVCRVATLSPRARTPPDESPIRRRRFGDTISPSTICPRPHVRQRRESEDRKNLFTPRTSSTATYIGTPRLPRAMNAAVSVTKNDRSRADQTRIWRLAIGR